MDRPEPIRPIYDHDGIRLFHADCGFVLGDLMTPVECVITDPPYHLRRYLCALEQHEEPQTIDHDAIWFSELTAWYLKWLPLVQRVAWNGPTWIFVGWEWAPILIRTCSLVQWPIRDLWTLPGEEALVLLGQYTLDAVSHDRIATALRVAGAQPMKPVDLIVTLLEVSGLRAGATVLDPFCGYGSTVMAARRLGLAGIGIEVRESLCRHTIEALEH